MGGLGRGTLSTRTKTVALVLSAVVLGAACGGSGGGASASSVCPSFEKLATLAKTMNGTNNMPSATQLEAEVKALDDVAKHAPASLKRQAKELDAYLTQLTGAMKAAGNDPKKQFSAVMAEALNPAAKNVKADGDALASYAKTTCNVVIPNDSSSDDNSASGNSSSAGSGSSSGGGSISLGSQPSHSTVFDTQVQQVLDAPPLDQYHVLGMVEGGPTGSIINATGYELDPTSAMIVCHALDDLAQAKNANVTIQVDGRQGLMASASRPGSCTPAG
jgi:hypothetical protein